MLTLLLASRNAGKLREFSELLPDITLVSWPSAAPEIPEDGAFFQENALQKATAASRWWAEHGDRPVDGVIADDSGICVDALWGGPGVLSARFAKDLDDDAKNRHLLSMLSPQSSRTARYVCVIACVGLEPKPFTVDGAIEGSLAPEPIGTNGFGYDPIFIPEGYQQTFGELSSAIKHTMSHRGRAAEALLARLAGRRA